MLAILVEPLLILITLLRKGLLLCWCHVLGQISTFRNTWTVIQDVTFQFILLLPGSNNLYITLVHFGFVLAKAQNTLARVTNHIKVWCHWDISLV